VVQGAAEEARGGQVEPLEICERMPDDAPRVASRCYKPTHRSRWMRAVSIQRTLVFRSVGFCMREAQQQFASPWRTFFRGLPSTTCCSKWPDQALPLASFALLLARPSPWGLGWPCGKSSQLERTRKRYSLCCTGSDVSRWDPLLVPVLLGLAGVSADSVGVITLLSLLSVVASSSLRITSKFCKYLCYIELGFVFFP